MNLTLPLQAEVSFHQQGPQSWWCVYCKLNTLFFPISFSEECGLWSGYFLTCILERRPEFMLLSHFESWGPTSLRPLFLSSPSFPPQLDLWFNIPNCVYALPDVAPSSAPVENIFPFLPPSGPIGSCFTLCFCFALSDACAVSHCSNVLCLFHCPQYAYQHFWNSHYSSEPECPWGFGFDPWPHSVG